LHPRLSPSVVWFEEGRQIDDPHSEADALVVSGPTGSTSIRECESEKVGQVSKRRRESVGAAFKNVRGYEVVSELPPNKFNEAFPAAVWRTVDRCGCLVHSPN
jgi:hypothetical protein